MTTDTARRTIAARLTGSLAALALLVAVPPAAAQDPAPAEDAAAAWETWTPTWSDSDIARLAEALSGSWLSTIPVEAFGGEGDAGSVNYRLLINPAPVAGVPDALYVESYRVDEPASPFRQAVMQFYRGKDGLRLRTFEINFLDQADEIARGVFVGMGLVPEAFPQLSREDLIATLDLAITPSRNGFSGETPYPYPTGEGGAVEMTSSMTLAGDTLTTADRGYGPDGSVVWGAGESGEYTFRRESASHIEVDRRDDGLIIMDLISPETGDAPQDGDTMYVHYTGWTVDANKFDSSYDRNRPWAVTYPPDRVIDGWKRGFGDVRTGTFRKLVIPSQLAYGAQGVPRSGIPANATLYFHTEIMAVQSPPETNTSVSPTPGG